MPIYEYECENCGSVDEVMQKFSDKPLTRCRHCSGKVHKLISHSAFHLKGSGWYATDYAGKAKTDTQKAATDASPGKVKAEKTPAGGEATGTKSD